MPSKERYRAFAEQIAADIKQRAEWRELEARWRRQHDPAEWRHGFNPGYLKYLDLETWLPYYIRVARMLGLEQNRQLDILDIGCGTGLFGSVCTFFGHRYLGLDIGNQMFDEIWAALQLDCRKIPVLANQPLPDLGRQFDLITALATKFHICEHIDGTKIEFDWGRGEWAYFLTDCRSRLQPGGRIFLKLNAVEDLPAEVIELLDGEWLSGNEVVLQAEYLGPE